MIRLGILGSHSWFSSAQPTLFRLHAGLSPTDTSNNGAETTAPGTTKHFIQSTCLPTFDSNQAVWPQTWQSSNHPLLPLHHPWHAGGTLGVIYCNVPRLAFNHSCRVPGNSIKQNPDAGHI
ncbi:hypothetical protein IQ07DRAFT_285956 [Pyrenochaeta sp. DS3sAY3a]|nr:hypothetical protein IQ07DRAFT_285956 [Pyrenochaeta sp. DS3sAY3a]